MKPLYVLLSTFFIALFVVKISTGSWDKIFSGNIAMSIMLLFTAIGHFKFRKGMKIMLPEFIPFKKEVILLTGLIEIAAAIGLQIPGLQYLTSVMLIIFFLAILPANINAQ
jgi:uncharacterized membrane protein